MKEKDFYSLLTKKEKTFLETLKEDKEVFNIYLRGSFLYGTFNEKSDLDFILIVKEKVIEERNFGKMDLHFYSLEEWREEAKENSIIFCEAFFSEEKFKIKEEVKIAFILNKKNLRSSFSKVASNSFVKAKKKIEKEKDFYIGKKSLFHSLRIIDFGIQILRDNKINFKNKKETFEEIFKIDSNNWKVFKERFQKEYNSLKTDFRRLA